jgi:hypothetical protein
MNQFINFPKQNLVIRFLAMLVLLGGLQDALAQPTIVSTVPANGATGVSPSAAVVFTFSTAMDTDDTTAFFFDVTASALVPVVPVWSSGNTVLTCTPSSAFVNNHTIQWVISGEDTDGNDLGGIPEGTFTISSGGGGGGGGGSGTNALTTFVVGKAWEYDQNSAAAPALDPDAPYIFSALTVLASNRTATAITVMLPTSSVSNLVQNFLEPEDYYLFYFTTNLSALTTTFTAGNYLFNVASNTANQSVTVNLPDVTQPNAPQVSNYTAAQAINPSQPFTLTWNAFTGGTSADYISVNIGDNFGTGGLGQTNALKGTATSFTIPAGTLQTNSNYDCSIGFYHAVVVSNTVSKYVTEAYVATLTDFSINTAGSAAAAPVLTNAAWNAGIFGFDILTSPGQTLMVVSTTNLNSAVATWPVLLTTNSPGSKVHITDSRAKTSKYMFYRARNGS